MPARRFKKLSDKQLLTHYNGHPQSSQYAKPFSSIIFASWLHPASGPALSGYKNFSTPVPSQTTHFELPYKPEPRHRPQVSRNRKSLVFMLQLLLGISGFSASISVLFIAIISLKSLSKNSKHSACVATISISDKSPD